MLPDRTSETFVAWLTTHPGAEIICRHRASTCTKAVKEAAPNTLACRSALLLTRSAVQALHWDVLRALSHPDQVIRRAQWDYCHMRGAPQALAEALGSTELVVLGRVDRPF